MWNEIFEEKLILNMSKVIMVICLTCIKSCWNCSLSHYLHHKDLVLLPPGMVLYIGQMIEIFILEFGQYSIREIYVLERDVCIRKVFLLERDVY